VNLNIKVSKTLNHWLLLLASFRFCETQYLHFTTCVFGHSAITPFLGGAVGLTFEESDLSDYRALLSDYRALLSDYRALWSDYRALLGDYRALLSDYRALLSDYRAHWSDYRALLSD